MVLHDRSTPVRSYLLATDDSRSALARSFARRFLPLPDTPCVVPGSIRSVFAARIHSSADVDVGGSLVRRGTPSSDLPSSPSARSAGARPRASSSLAVLLGRRRLHRAPSPPPASASSFERIGGIIIVSSLFELLRTPRPAHLGLLGCCPVPLETPSRF